MKREELKSLGLTDEQIDKVMAINGQDVNAQKALLDAEKAKAQEAGTQLSKLTADLAAAQKNTGDVTALKAQLTQAQEALSSAQKTGKLRAALGEFKPRDAELLLRLIDQSKVTVTETGEMTGLKDQVEALRQTSGYLFADTPTDKGGAPAGGSGGGDFNMNDFLRGK